MKRRTATVAPAIAALVVPAAIASLMLFHPGVAFSTPRFLAWSKASSLPQSGGYTPDPMHTSIGFEIEHLGLSRVQGRFTKFTGHLAADRDLAASSVTITVQTDSVDTAVAPRDADLRSPNFFNVEKYPTMTFQSTSIRKAGPRYVADGTLTLLGVSKPVRISFQVYGPIKDPWGNQRIGIVSSPFIVRRSDFGMTYDLKNKDGSVGVGDDVTVRLSLEATRDK